MTEANNPRRETYGQTDNRVFETQITSRVAVREAAFVLPYLRPGMRLLDVGCGPSSITLGLAEAVAPGEVVGVDLQPGMVERASTAAADAGVPNITFQVGDCYELPFPDQSFDVAFVHMVLQHLREPVKALAEVRRVLRPGGFVALGDFANADVIGPPSPLVSEALALNFRVREFNGGDPNAGPRHREHLLAAGFAKSLGSAVADCAATLEETREMAAFSNSVMQGSFRTALAQGWVDQARIDEMMAATTAWGERPDAFRVMLRCNAIGWVDVAVTS